MLVVSDSSPLIFLSKINKLNLLQKLFKEIIIPQEVFDEITSKNSEEVLHFKSFDFFKVIKPKKILEFGLGRGEQAAISLGLEKKAERILLDDSKARAVASELKLKPLGTIGILLLFLLKKFISFNEFELLLHNLIKLNFRISIELFAETFNQAKYIEKKVK